VPFGTMARILAIDYGTKRVGLAVTDPGQIIASALATIHPKDLLKYLKDYLAKEEVECIVVGEPKTLKNEVTDATRHIEGFVKLLRKELPDVKIERMDERFTSSMAQRTLLDSGLKKKDRQNKELLDQVSATIILQSYLDSRQWKQK
jgi:putative holliday junction resolvase